MHNPEREKNLEATIRELRARLRDLENKLTQNKKNPPVKKKGVRKKDVKFDRSSDAGAEPGPVVERQD